MPDIHENPNTATQQLTLEIERGRHHDLIQKYTPKITASTGSIT